MESIQQSLEFMMKHFDDKMAAFQEDLQKASAVPLTLTSLAADFNTFKSFITVTLGSLQKQIQLIAQQQDQIETRSRRKILLLHGIREGGSDNMTAEVVKTIGERLNIPITAECIIRSHRMGRITSGKPRPILVKFGNIEIRDKVWFAKTGFKSSGITLSEFLTKRRHDAFVAARKHFGVSKCWTRDGYVVIDGSDGKRHRVDSVDEVKRIIDSSPVAAVDTAPSAASTAAVLTRPKRNTKK
ncbi:uncharacterized protein ACR2FA_007020 [Aphomia sociella]